jgi:hypothetical protein
LFFNIKHLLYDKITENIMQILGRKRQCYSFGYGCDKTCGDLLPAFETSYKIVLIDLVGSGNLIPMILTNTIPSSTQTILILLRNYA